MVNRVHGRRATAQQPHAGVLRRPSGTSRRAYCVGIPQRPGTVPVGGIAGGAVGRRQVPIREQAGTERLQRVGGEVFEGIFQHHKVTAAWRVPGISALAHGHAHAPDAAAGHRDGVLKSHAGLLVGARAGALVHGLAEAVKRLPRLPAAGAQTVRHAGGGGGQHQAAFAQDVATALVRDAGADAGAQVIVGEVAAAGQGHGQVVGVQHHVVRVQQDLDKLVELEATAGREAVAQRGRGVEGDTAGGYHQPERRGVVIHLGQRGQAAHRKDALLHREVGRERRERNCEVRHGLEQVLHVGG